MSSNAKPFTSFTRLMNATGSLRHTPKQRLPPLAQAQSERQSKMPALMRSPPQIAKSGHRVQPSFNGKSRLNHNAASGGDGGLRLANFFGIVVYCRRNAISAVRLTGRNWAT